MLTKLGNQGLRRCNLIRLGVFSSRYERGQFCKNEALESLRGTKQE